MNTSRPVALRVSPDAIPAELKSIDAWVTWRYELDKRQEWAKVPYQQDISVKASTTDPETWASFEKVITRYQRGGVDGVGFVLAKENGIAGVDLDHCFDESKKINLWALKIIFELDSYTEISPSENGVRIFLKATLPPGGRKKNNIEMYDNARYLTVTGCHRAGTPRTIEARQQALEALHRRVLEETKNERSAPKRETGCRPRLEGDEILQKAFNARNGHKAKALYSGDIGGYPSQSEADLAFCSLLAYYTEDPMQVDRLFRTSALYREKWDTRHYGDGRSYGEATIAKALAGRANV
jgi:putative DNA primase/helicase